MFFPGIHDVQHVCMRKASPFFPVDSLFCIDSALKNVGGICTDTGLACLSCLSGGGQCGSIVVTVGSMKDFLWLFNPVVSSSVQ